MAAPAQLGDLLRRSDSVRRRCSDRFTMPLTLAVADVAIEPRREMRVPAEVFRDLAVASRANLVQRLLRDRLRGADRRSQREQSDYNPH